MLLSDTHQQYIQGFPSSTIIMMNEPSPPQLVMDCTPESYNTNYMPFLYHNPAPLKTYNISNSAPRSVKSYIKIKPLPAPEGKKNDVSDKLSSNSLKLQNRPLISKPKELLQHKKLLNPKIRPIAPDNLNYNGYTGKALLGIILQKNVDEMKSDDSKGLVVAFMAKLFEKPPEYLHTNKYTKLQSFMFNIDLTGLAKLLLSWSLFYNYKTVPTERHDDLYKFLKNKWIEFIELKNIAISNLLTDLDSEFYIQTSCSLRTLKLLFHNTPKLIYYRRKRELDILLNHRVTFPQYMYNWPHIKMRIDLPSFVMIHQVMSADEYNIVDVLRKEKLTYKKENTNLYMRQKKGSSDEFTAKFIITFLNQLLIDLNSNLTCFIPWKRRAEVTNLITELIQDVALCSNFIETDKQYIFNTNPYPYERYLSHVDDEDVQERTGDYKLRQVSLPKIGFQLKTFNIKYKQQGDLVRFIYPCTFLHQLEDCVTYICTICNVNLGKTSPSQQIFDHLTKFHGHEPNWSCVNCGLSLSTSSLSKKRWRHDCEINELANR